MGNTGIETRLIYGFLDAGKTTYIQDTILHDYFHKYGKTLVLCFEQGETEYDEQALSAYRTDVAYYEDGSDVTAFCLDAISKFRPDRIYVEMNIMMDLPRERFPAEMNITWSAAWFDWTTMGLYLANLKQHVSRMVKDCAQVTFRGCPSKELLSPYSQTFRMMNRTAVYLRQDPMGYHEKAFDLFLPYSLEDPVLEISARDHIALWLDAMDHPEHYTEKRIRFTDPLELRQDAPVPGPNAGRVVMTCCMADLQFMGFPLECSTSLPGAWILLESSALIREDPYHRKYLCLQVLRADPAKPPQDLILSTAAGVS